MKNIKRILFYLFFLSTPFLFSQENTRSIFLELGGSAGFYSFNFEKEFKKTESIDWFWRVGISGHQIDKNSGFVMIVPAIVGGMIGGDNHKFEFGIGQGLSFTTKGSAFLITTPFLGYRYNISNKPLFFRLTYTPLVSYLLGVQYQNWAGVSIGYHLK